MSDARTCRIDGRLCIGAAEVLAALDAKDKHIERLEAALRYYANTFCEYGSDHECCGKLDRQECSGCYARAALNPASAAKEG